jgi:uncharacterized protein Yka (UPF0111/DUF47 family)
MVLPAETEQRLKRRALSACQDNLRKVVDLTRKIPQMVEHFSKDDKELARQLFNEIRKGEDFLRFTNLSSEIADFSEGIAYYLIEIMEHNWKVPGDIKRDLLGLSEAVFESVLKLRETMMVLNYGSSKTLEKAKDVEIAERTVDDLYRALSIKVLNSKLDLPVLLLMRDVLQLLENSADKAEDAADTARILSFIM